MNIGFEAHLALYKSQFCLTRHYFKCGKENIKQNKNLERMRVLPENQASMPAVPCGARRRRQSLCDVRLAPPAARDPSLLSPSRVLATQRISATAEMCRQICQLNEQRRPQGKAA